MNFFEQEVAKDDEKDFTTDEKVLNANQTNINEVRAEVITEIGAITSAQQRNELIRKLVSKMVELGNVDKRDFNKMVSEISAEVKAIRRGMSNGYLRYSIKQEQGRYVMSRFSSDGGESVEALTNFEFTSVKKALYGEGSALLVDAQLNGRLISNIILGPDDQIDQRRFAKTLKARDAQFSVLCSRDIFPTLIHYITEQASEEIEVKDYTGLFYDEASEKYYYVVNSGKENQHTYILPDDIEDNGNLVKITGPRHKKSDLFVRNVLTDDSWMKQAKRLLYFGTNSLAGHKSYIMLGWFFAALISHWLFERKEIKLPILFLYGEPGSGKTTTLHLISSFFGMKRNEGIQMGSSAQPLRNTMSSSNAFPIISREYDDKATNISTVTNMLKNLYDRSPYERGYPGYDESWTLQAPWVMQSNEQSSNEAVQDRCLQILIQKSDQNPMNAEIKKACLAHTSNRAFIEGYLKYLIDCQHKWEEYYQKAVQLVATTDLGSRSTDILLTVTVGLIMLEDLKRELKEKTMSNEQIMEIVHVAARFKQENQMKPIEIQFLEYVQNFHAIERVAVEKIIEMVGNEIRLHQAQWLERFGSRVSKGGADFSNKLLLEGLKKLKAVEVNKGTRIMKATVRGIVFNIYDLEKETGIPADLWNDPKKVSPKLEAEELLMVGSAQEN